MQSIAEWGRRGQRKVQQHSERGTAWSPLWVAAIVSAALAYVAIHNRYPIYEYHNVSVLERVAPNEWWMLKDDGRFLYKGCPDFPNERVIWVGYVAAKIRYEEQGNCKSILRSDLGFWWERDEHGNAKEITNVGSAR